MPTSEECVKIRSGDKRFRTGNERGSAMLELSLVLPILLMLVTGQLAFGFAIHNYMVLTNAVNVGSQVLSFSRGQTTDPCSTVTTAINNAAWGLTTANLSYTLVLNGTSYSGTTCTSGASNMVQAASAQVTVTYPCNIGMYIYAVLDSYACTLKAQTTEMVQ